MIPQDTVNVRLVLYKAQGYNTTSITMAKPI